MIMKEEINKLPISSRGHHIINKCWVLLYTSKNNNFIANHILEDQYVFVLWNIIAWLVFFNKFPAINAQ